MKWVRTEQGNDKTYTKLNTQVKQYIVYFWKQKKRKSGKKNKIESKILCSSEAWRVQSKSRQIFEFFIHFCYCFFFGNHSEISVFIFSAKRNETKRIESKLRSPFARVYLIHTHTHSRTEPFDYHFSIKLFRFIDSRARRKRRNHFIRRCEELTVRFCAILNVKSMCWCVLEIFSFCVYKTNGTERNE